MLEEKITAAQHRIEALWLETGGRCYVSFSGGKDSTVILSLVKLCQELGTVGDIPAVFCNTGIELGVTLDFVAFTGDCFYNDMCIIRPKKSFAEVLKTAGKPLRSKLKSHNLHQYHCGTRTEPLLLALLDKEKHGRTALADRDMHFLHDRFPITPSEKCCDFLKKEPFALFNRENGMKGTLLGIRLVEGGVRSITAVNRDRDGHICTAVKSNGFIQKYPLIDWTDEDIDEYIESFDVPLSKAYTDFGFKRTGCAFCPFAKNIQMDLKHLYDNEPKKYAAALFWLKDVYIAQNVILPFDSSYEREREREWHESYEPMRQEMLRKYRPSSKLVKTADQLCLNLSAE